MRSCGITTAATPAPGSPAGQKVSRHSQLLRDLALPCKTSGNLLTLHLILHVVQVIELGLGAATDRAQSFVHTGLTTAYFPVTYSVPQGSVFGPWVSSPTLTTHSRVRQAQRPLSHVRRRHTALRQQLTRRRRVCARPPDQLCL